MVYMIADRREIASGDLALKPVHFAGPTVFWAASQILSGIIFAIEYLIRPKLKVVRKT